VTYGQVAADPNARKLVETAGYELLAVARAAGVHPAGYSESQAALEASFKIATQAAAAYSSTAQDMMRGKRTEIDSLNGYIARRGAELGVPTPVHQALYTLVKLAEGGT
jgi:2-dehydropantoate 2-reductase